MQTVAPNRSPTAIRNDESSSRLPRVAIGKAESQAADSLLDVASRRDWVMTSAFSRRAFLAFFGGIQKLLDILIKITIFTLTTYKRASVLDMFYQFAVRCT